MHRLQLIHRDIETSNLLFDDEANAKLCDLGFARQTDDDFMTRLGTAQYIAPEVFDDTYAT